ncbi:MAG TPA: hypothetical protein VKQ07_07980 [Jatrophihabitantaceae bacterium]|nr:hypothetical protein [Jatrophihabitantaceae bacterium]
MLRLLVAAAALLVVVLALLAGCHGHTSRHRALLPRSNAPGGGAAAGARIADLVITGAPAPSSAQRLYPGTRGDVALSVRNPNPFPVTLRAVRLPAATVYADGFADATLREPKPDCAATTPSRVAWVDKDSPASAHTFSRTVVVGAKATVLLIVRDAVSMETTAPTACAGAFFKMPSFAGVDAAVGGVPAGGPVTVTWRG